MLFQTWEFGERVKIQFSQYKFYNLVLQEPSQGMLFSFCKFFSGTVLQKQTTSSQTLLCIHVSIICLNI